MNLPEALYGSELHVYFADILLHSLVSFDFDVILCKNDKRATFVPAQAWLLF